VRGHHVHPLRQGHQPLGPQGEPTAALGPCGRRLRLHERVLLRHPALAAQRRGGHHLHLPGDNRRSRSAAVGRVLGRVGRPGLGAVHVWRGADQHLGLPNVGQAGLPDEPLRLSGSPHPAGRAHRRCAGRRDELRGVPPGARAQRCPPHGFCELLCGCGHHPRAHLQLPLRGEVVLAYKRPGHS
ncbi:unnamed protein product, partial [Effrenium voratum]